MLESQYGINGVGYKNMSHVFNPKHSLNYDLIDQRETLLKGGMARETVDLLAEQFILQRHETAAGSFKFHQLLSNGSEAANLVADSSFGLIDFYTPTLKNYRTAVRDLRAEANKLNNYMRAGADVSYLVKSLEEKKKNLGFMNSVSSPVQVNSSTPRTARFFSAAEGSSFTEYLKKLNKVEEQVYEENVQAVEEEEKKSLEEILTETVEEEIKSHPELQTIDYSSVIKRAREAYPPKFYEVFALGADNRQQMQQSFEEYITQMDKEEIPLLVLSMILNNLVLNEDIPNIELLFYHIFMSPKINAEARKEAETKGNLIEGNIFKNHVTRLGYLSLLRTVNLTGKKKHLKKILSHMHEYQPAYDMTDDLVNMVIDACQRHNFPILLGQAMRGFIDRGVPLE